MTSELHVIFGTGPLGKWTARHLLKQGYRVRLVNRSGQTPDLPAGAEIVRGDAYDRAQAAALVAGAAAVYQCAQPQYHEWVEKFPPLQESILAATTAAGAKLIVAENLYMYGDTHGQPMTESTPNNAHTRKGKVRQQMSAALMQAHQQGKVRVAMARGSDFFGPEDTVQSGFVYRPALAGKAVNQVGRTDQPHTFTYVADFGALLATLGTHDEALGEIWHVPSNAPVTQAELLAILSEALGKPVKTQVAGRFMLSLLGLFNPGAKEMVEMLYEFTQPFIMDSSKAQKAFGLRPTPLPEAVRATLDWCRTHP
jgi:nucleoside-diphosphate-sugar epimerase